MLMNLFNIFKGSNDSFHFNALFLIHHFNTNPVFLQILKQ